MTDPRLYTPAQRLMPINDQDIETIAPRPMKPLTLTFLPEAFKGLVTTFRHMIQNSPLRPLMKLAGGRDMRRTVSYPEQRREQMPIGEGGIHKANYRGIHRLNRDDQGRVRCTACFMCSTACPADCITIEAAEAPWPDREKYPVKFQIDELRCIYCGMCEEACPVDAIELTHMYDATSQSRSQMIFDKEMLLAVYDRTVAEKPM